MASEHPTRGNLRRADRWLASGLLLYGAVGVAVQLRLLGVLAAGVAAWGGGLDFHSGPLAIPGLGALEAHFQGLPALPWAAWLLGLIGLAGGAMPPGASPRQGRDWRRVALVVLPLAVVGVVAAWARLNQLVPPAYGISHYP